MAINDAVCADKNMAILILETFKENMKVGTQRDALEAVIDWIQKTAVDDSVFKMTSEEREARISELLEKCEYMRNRDNMSVGERKEAAAYYLEGIKSSHSKTDK